MSGSRRVARLRQGGVQAQGGGVEPGGEEPRDDRDGAGAAAQRQGEGVLVDEDRLVPERTVGQLLGLLHLVARPGVVVDDGGELLAAGHVHDQPAHRQLVVHRAGDHGGEGDRLQAAVQLVGEPDELADQRLGVAVGVERVDRLAVGRRG